MDTLGDNTNASANVQAEQLITTSQLVASLLTLVIEIGKMCDIAAAVVNAISTGSFTLSGDRSGRNARLMAHDGTFDAEIPEEVIVSLHKIGIIEFGSHQ